MKAPWAIAWGWLIGYGLAVAGAGEYAWQPAAAKPAQAAPPLGVSLGRPSSLADAVSLSPPAAADPGVTRISYTTPTAPVVVRMQSADAGSRLVPQPVLSSNAGSRLVPQPVLSPGAGLRFGPQTVWQRMPSGPPSPSTGFATASNASGPVQSQPLTAFGCGNACGCDSNCCGNCCGSTCCDSTCCDSTCCDDPCSCCCPGLLDGPAPKRGNNWYTSAEYLLWFIRGSSYPPLVATGPAADPTATTLFGGSTVTNGPLSGARFRLGYWFDDCRTCGLEGSFFFLAPRSTNFFAGSDPSGNPNLSRPIFDPSGDPSREDVAVQNDSRGGVGVTTRTGLWGAELNYRHNLWGGGPWRFDGLAGFRYLNLYESLNINENATVLTTVPGFPAGTTLTGGDAFYTQNQFYGGQVGFICQYSWNRWVVNLRTTLGLGSTSQHLQIWGKETVVTPPSGTTTVYPGNLLAQRTNIGTFNQNHLSFVPEVGINLGYNVTENLRLFVGYNFLFWTNVIRPGDQIDPVVNPANAPPPFNKSTTLLPVTDPRRPMPLFNQTSFWAQGVNLGLQYKF